jgi:hypothetical protein
MILTKKQRKIFTFIIIVAGLLLVIGSFLPFLTAFQ